MHTLINGFIVFMLLLSSNIFAKRSFKQIHLPNTHCGEGENYNFFFDKLNTKKLILELQGGGNCWSTLSCKIANTFYDKDKITRISAFSTNLIQGRNLGEFSYAFLPYCTGDFFLGNFEQTYKNKTVYHHGLINLNKTLDFIKSIEKLDLANLEEVIIIGKSAGGIGALALMDHLNNQFINAKFKVLILDSPGLHYGNNVWNRVPDKLFDTLKIKAKDSGMLLKKDEGNVAYQFKNICRKYNDWEIGILQSTKDKVTSILLGSISQKRHKGLILSPSGIYETVKNEPNCHAWIHESSKHVLTMEKNIMENYVNKISAKYFLENILVGNGSSYK